MALPIRFGGVLVDFQPMSPDEIQRTMQFVLRQQAQFAADIPVWEDRLSRLSAKVDRVTDGLLGLTGVVGTISVEVGALVAAQRETDRLLKENAERQRETDQQLKENAERQRQTDRQLKETDERLNRLIGMFERHLRDDHGIRLS